jgi:hypothetical protein
MPDEQPEEPKIYKRPGLHLITHACCEKARFVEEEGVEYFKCPKHGTREVKPEDFLL